MTTWPEARAAKAERQRRERRHYRRTDMGRRCTVCREQMVTAVADAEGWATHPSCDLPEAAP